MSGNWRPRHENHAIEVMAVVLSFAEPIPDRLFAAVQRRAEANAFDAGLLSRHSLQGIRVSAAPNAIGPSLTQSAGFLYNAPGSPDIGGVSEQLQLEPTSFLYRTWSYSSWATQSERIRRLLLDPVEQAMQFVSPAVIRLEYLDRFIFDGPHTEAPTAALLRPDTQWVAPHVFGQTFGWHSHSGAFLDNGEIQNRIVQIHVDASDLPFPPSPGVETRRNIAIMTAREDRIRPPTFKPEDVGVAQLRELLDEMHDDLKRLLASVLTDSMSEQIYLNKDA